VQLLIEGFFGVLVFALPTGEAFDIPKILPVKVGVPSRFERGGGRDLDRRFFGISGFSGVEVGVKSTFFD